MKLTTMRMQIAKVAALPAQADRTPNTMYLVARVDSDSLEIHMTSSDGAATVHVPTKTEISAMIGGQIASFNNIRVVATYADMAALVAENNSMVVMVLDATGDATVATGGAAYVLQATGTAAAPAASYYKIYEYEALTENFVLNWSAIVGKPASSAAAIDDAVAKTHTHANKALLDGLAINPDGDLTLDGVAVGTVLVTATW